jgi:hypothetical protein
MVHILYSFLMSVSQDDKPAPDFFERPECQVELVLNSQSGLELDVPYWSDV